MIKLTSNYYPVCSFLRRQAAGLFALAAGVILTETASAANFEFVRIAGNTDHDPLGAPFGQANDFDLDGNNLVFRSLQTGDIYLSTSSGISIVATPTTSLPGGTSGSSLNTPSIAGTDVGFAKHNPSGNAIYVQRGGNISLLADSSTPVPNSTGNFTSLLFGSTYSGDQTPGSVNSAISSTAAVFAGNSAGGGLGLYYAGTDGVIHRIVDGNTAVKPSSTVSIDGNNAVFVGGPSQDQLGVYSFSVANQNLTPLLAPGTPLPSGSLADILNAPTLSGANAAFVTDSAVYTVIGGSLQLVAQPGMAAPGSNFPFATALDTGVTISGTSVAFEGVTTDRTSGIYTTLGGQLTKVISTNDTLNGSAITTLFGAPKISGPNIAFSTNQGLYVAMSEHHWAATGGGSWDTASNWSFGLAPRALIPTFLDPANGATITGPAGNVSLAALTVGATQSGIADLQLQASGQLSVNGPITITSAGRIEAAGTLSATGPITNNGVITGSGQVAGQVINSVAGEIRITAGNSLLLSGTTNANAGTIDATNGQIEFSKGLVNQPSTGLISAQGATLRFDGGLTNAGALALVSGGNDVYGAVQNTGNITISGGAGGTAQTVVFHDDVVQNGTLTISAVGQTRSVAVFLGSFTGSGGISGSGDVFFEGDLRPGAGAASLTLNTTATFSHQAELTMDLGGRIEGSQYDHVDFNNLVTFDGTLQIDLINNFHPTAGDRFDLFDFNPAEATGAFSSLDLPALQAGLSWDTSALSTTGMISVVPEPSAPLLAALGIGLIFTRRPRSNK